MLMASDGLTTSKYIDKAMEDSNLCDNILDLHDGSGSKELEVTEGDIGKESEQSEQFGESPEVEENSSDLGTANSDDTDTVEKEAAGCNHEACQTIILNAESVKQDVSDVSGNLLHQATTSPESSREEDAGSNNRELGDMSQSGEPWEQMTYDSNPEEDYVSISRRGTYSDLSTLRAGSTDGTDVSLVNSDSCILDAVVVESKLAANGKFLPSCDSFSSDIEFMETNDPGMEDFSLVPVDLPHVSLVSNNSHPINEIGAGSTAFHSLNLNITGGDWHMASLPEKCLETGAVNVASLTLGTVGISVIPMVSSGTIDINPFTNCIGMLPIDPIDWETWSMDSMSLATMSAEYVNVDSITPEGVRERWHPLEERLYALGEALAAFDKKLEGFSPRIQEAETLLNEVELSFSQHATHIADIMKENNALAERVLLLEERLSREKQQQDIWLKKSEEES